MPGQTKWVENYIAYFICNIEFRENLSFMGFLAVHCYEAKLCAENGISLKEVVETSYLHEAFLHVLPWRH